MKHIILEKRYFEYFIRLLNIGKIMKGTVLLIFY